MVQLAPKGECCMNYKQLKAVSIDAGLLGLDLLLKSFMDKHLPKVSDKLGSRNSIIFIWLGIAAFDYLLNAEHKKTDIEMAEEIIGTWRNEESAIADCEARWFVASDADRVAMVQRIYDGGWVRGRWHTPEEIARVPWHLLPYEFRVDLATA
jgi:succinate dehydrogenase flavin-adding protein (antitoxin of CptAB toxin-antitoxin module)